MTSFRSHPGLRLRPSFFYFPFLLCSYILVTHTAHAAKRCADLAGPNQVSQAYLLLAASLPTTNEVISDLRKSGGQGYRSNPALLDVELLQKGQEVFVVPEVFREFPRIAKKVFGPVKMVVVDIFETTRNRSFMQTDRFKKFGSWKVFYLESPLTGRVGILEHRLARGVYSRRDYSLQSPFVSDEWVQFGYEFREINEFEIANSFGDKANFSGNALVYLGRFVRALDADNLIVKVIGQNKKNKWVQVEIIAPRGQVKGLISGTPARFKERLKALLHLPLEFGQNDLIRYRAADGLIRLGFFVRKFKRYSVIRDAAGSVQNVRNESVFRYVEGDPFTPVFSEGWIQAKFNMPKPFLGNLLDGAGKLTSLSDYAKMSSTERIRTITEYLRANVSWMIGAKMAEAAGLIDFDRIVSVGAGVCRHLAVLLATMLAEAGFSPRLVIFQEDGNKNGHAWLEVDIQEKERSVTYVVDPSNMNSNYVVPFSDVSKAAIANKGSIEATMYIQPGRKYFIKYSNDDNEPAN